MTVVKSCAGGALSKVPNFHPFPAFFLHVMDFFAVLKSIFIVNMHMEDKISQLLVLMELCE